MMNDDLSNVKVFCCWSLDLMLVVLSQTYCVMWSLTLSRSKSQFLLDLHYTNQLETRDGGDP